MTYTGLNVKCTKIQPWPIWKYINNNKWPMDHIAKTEQTWIPFTNGAVEIGPLFLEIKIFKFLQCIFAISLSSALRKESGPFVWRYLNPLYPRMLCAKFCWNWPSGSGEDETVSSLQTDRGQVTEELTNFRLRWIKDAYQ